MERLMAVSRMNRRLWRHCLEGTEVFLWRRPVDSVNAFGFLALLLIEVRHYMLQLLEAASDHPFAELLGGASCMDDLAEHPGMEPLVSAWEEVSENLEKALQSLTVERLAAPMARSFPNDAPCLAGALEFLLHHESYHVGQMALLCRCFGLAPMRYA
jgi:hypothetical protein